ncbi:MAG: L,D-transpeptidase family protein [Pseudomonadota bacterium]
MTAVTSHRRRFIIAGAAFAALGVTGLGLVRFLPALGPIAGTIAPQLYVNSLPNAQIPLRGRYILVDAASARLYMFEDGRILDSMKVIVGKPDSPTPELKSVINYETLNPYWHVSEELTRSLIAANVLKQGMSYLNDRGYQVVSKWAPDAEIIPPETIDWEAVAAGRTKILVRQLPGPANSLGFFKFDLPNGDGIYLHDTPKKELFALDARNISHGCVRLEDAPKLAEWLLGRDPPPGSRPEEHVLLPKPVPIMISYLDQGSQMRLAALR